MDEESPLLPMLRSLPVPALLADERRRISFVNPAFERATGYRSAELLGRSCALLQGEGTDPAAIERMREALDDERPFRGQILNHRKDGEPFWNSLAITPLHDEDGRLSGFMSVQLDVATQFEERVEAAVSAERIGRDRPEPPAPDLAALAGALVALARDAGADGAALVLTDPLRVLGRAPEGDDAAEPLAVRVLGLLDEEVLARGAVVHADGPVAAGTLLQTVMREHGIASLSVAPLGVAGRTEAVLLSTWTGDGARADDPLVAGRLGRAARISALALETALALERSRSSVDRDQLTGLLSRSGLQHRLEQALASGRREVGVVYADVDRFKRINDSMGHAGGDRFLEHLADRLLVALGGDTLVGRPGGDEFVLVFGDGASEASIDAALDRVATALQPPFTVQDQLVYGALSLGRTLGRKRPAESPKEAADRLMHEADSAMYEAKRLRQGARRVDTTFDAVVLEADLHRALELDEIQTYFQPQFDCDTGRLSGYEALARWNHRALGLISPDEFIPLAEESGLITAIGHRILQQSFDFARRAARRSPLRIALNLSAHQLVAPDFVERFEALLATQEQRAWTLIAEVGEQDLAARRGPVDETIRALRDLGAEIAIDDFGTGHSSLALLQDLPVTEVKVDRSFVQREGALGASMVGAIVEFAHGLDLQVSADGVETVDQLELLTGLGCQRVQGFLLGAPMRAADALAVPMTIHAPQQGARSSRRR